MVRVDGSQIAKSLFEPIPDDTVNEYEKAIALYLDDHPEVLWWYRNLVGDTYFGIDGFEPPRVFPDIIASTDYDAKTPP